MAGKLQPDPRPAHLPSQRLSLNAGLCSFAHTNACQSIHMSVYVLCMHTIGAKGEVGGHKSRLGDAHHVHENVHAVYPQGVCA